MKTEFKAKFLQHVAKKRKEEGFTLIELLVVIIIIGILSAIALPSFLNQANKAKQSEAKQYLASINKGQQAYYAENGTFVIGPIQDNIGQLGLGIKTATGNYTYNISAATQQVGATADELGVAAWTDETATGLRGYAAIVYLTDADGALTSQTIICEGEVGLSDEPTYNSECVGSGYETPL
ncbi:prepilin-type N-terminal cleavage/methylation domain-containing protein [Okeania hirsuta]|uniref:Prepilin-type N-terminal cleavage/methylation domain-containing protein n=1 Tax=Okeania hirsuta TaxID=1458930 RepID=A0A3N6PRG4_9CYAN|nr:type IV pilin-like G/H family protein [Okeania hirsuta]RQH38040.1 prepilin-type N-terminal cleavage/methylation domain-containing protein [Okeania hirsuta]